MQLWSDTMKRRSPFGGFRLRRPRTVALFAGAVAACAAAAVSAGPPAWLGGHHGPDYPISVPEARDRAEAHFQELDADGSGEISAAELASAPRGERWVIRHHGHHAHARRSGDGDASAAGERHAAMNTAVFERLDEDGDGLLSKTELDMRRLREVRHELMRERVFARLDADASGGLSREELPDRSRRLAAMDADDDGTVTREEARAHRERHRHARSGSRHADRR